MPGAGDAQSYWRPTDAILDSRTGFEELQHELVSGEASLYAVGQYSESMRGLYMTGDKYFKPPSLDENLNPVWVLRQLAQWTGGRAVFPGPGDPVAPLFEEIASGLGHQYLLGFDPGTDKDGADEPRFRAIDVTLAPGVQNRESYLVRTRRGYVR